MSPISKIATLRVQLKPWPMLLAVSAALMLGMVIFGPWLAPNDPHYADILNRLAPPGGQFPLGTDALGRCVLSRLLYGGQVTIFWAALIVALSVSIGTMIGLVCGYVGGWLDGLVMRLVEGFSVLPALAIALVVAGIMGLGLNALVIALVTVSWTEYARIVRNVCVGEKSRPYVLAAEALGAPPLHILFRHILPNLVSPVLVLATYSLSGVILAFAGLSFLGLGVEPSVPEWGRMIADARNHMRQHPLLVIVPGCTIMTFIILLNLIGDALSDRWRGGNSI